MGDTMLLSIRMLVLSIAGLLLVKFIILKAGRPINYTFLSFFWFSRWQISNSSFQYSKRKRKVLNYLSLAMVFLIILEVIILAVTIIREI